MTIFKKHFMQKYNIKNGTMNESELQRVHNFSIYPRDSKIYSNRGFVNLDNGQMVGTHCVCFIIKDNKSHYFDSFRGCNNKILLSQLPKPIM